MHATSSALYLPLLSVIWQTHIVVCESNAVPKSVLQSDRQPPVSLPFSSSWRHLHWTLSSQRGAVHRHRALRYFSQLRSDAGVSDSEQRAKDCKGWWSVSSGDCGELVAGFVPTHLEVETDTRKRIVVGMSQFPKTLTCAVESPFFAFKISHDKLVDGNWLLRT